MTTSDNQPGWYDDPNDLSAQRYWDGQGWTPHRQRKPVSPPIRASAPPPAAPPLPQPPAAPPLPPPPGGAPAPPFGVPQSPPPGQPPQWSPPPADLSGAPQRSRKPVLIGALTGAVVLVAAAAGFYYFVYNSDEHQIKAVTQQFTDMYNNGDGAGLTKLFCSQGLGTSPDATGSALVLAFAGPAMNSQLRDELNQTGPITVSVSDIHVTGDRAMAKLTTTASKTNQQQTENEAYVKEGGSWKVCPSDS
jgi:hypothetical protein